MAEPIFETGTLTAVYVNVGKRTSDQSVKLKRANFDVLNWSATSTGAVEQYAVPLGFLRVTDTDLNDLLVPTNTSREAIEVGQEFGYYKVQPLVLDSVGGSGNTESWLGLHSFGHL